MHEVLTSEVNNKIDFENFTLKKLLVGNYLKPKVGKNLSPIVFINLCVDSKKDQIITLKALLDTGATSTIIKSKFVTKLDKRQCEPTAWKTANGYFETHEKVKTEFLIPELNDQRLITADMHETQQNMPYDLIIGIDLLKELGIDILNSKLTIKWDESETPFKDRSIKLNKAIQLEEEPEHV